MNTFVRSYAQFTDDYVAAYQAMKAGDNSKDQALQAKAPELQAEAAQMTGKVKPDEAATFSAFISKCAQKITGTLQSQWRIPRPKGMGYDLRPLRGESDRHAFQQSARAAP